MNSNSERDQNQRLTRQITSRFKKQGDLTRRIGKAERFHNDLATSIVQKYEKHEILHRLGGEPLPSRHAMIEIMDDLLEVMAPGYGHRHNLKLNNVGFFVRDRLAALEDRLVDQITLARRAVAFKGELPKRGIRSEARRQARVFLAKVPALMDYLAEDVECSYRGDPATRSIEEILSSLPGVWAIWMHRLAHELHLLKVPLIPRMMAEYAHSKTGIDVHPGAVIGHRFFCDHGTGVVIGETCIIHDDISIYQGVTLGALSLPRDKDGHVPRDGKQRHPTIKSGVIIYANATILGGKTVVGERATIGASAWITKSVAPGETIIRTATIEEPKQRGEDIALARWEDDGGSYV